MSTESDAGAGPAADADTGVGMWVTECAGWDRSTRKHALRQLLQRLADSVDGRDELLSLHDQIGPLLTRDFVGNLPWLVSVHILSFLELESLASASCVSKGWHGMATADKLWKRHCIARQLKPLHGHREQIAALALKDGGGGGPATVPFKQLLLGHGRLNKSWREKNVPVQNAHSPSPDDPNPTHTRITCHGHKVVTSLVPAGENHVISCSDDNSLKVWQIRPPTLTHTLVGHQGGVWSCATEGDFAVSGSTDHDLRVWNYITGKMEFRLQGHTSTVRCVCIANGIIVSGSRDTTVRVWDLNSGQQLHVLEGHEDAVRCIDFDGKIVVSGSYDTKVRVWSVEDGSCIHEMIGHLHKIYSIRLSPKYVVSGSLDMTIRVWDLESGKCHSVLKGHNSLTGTLFIRDDILVSANADKSLRLWNLNSGNCTHRLEGHQGAVTDIGVTSKYIVSCSDDGTVKLWNFLTGEFIRTLVDINSSYPELNNNGIVWRVFSNESSMICACGSRVNEQEQLTGLSFIDFTPPPVLALTDASPRRLTHT